MSVPPVDLLKSRGITPSAQRLAVADYVLKTSEHPSADAVWARVREHFPMVSRATVYNTLNLFVETGLLRELVLTEGKVVFDPVMAPHHHLVDEQTGEIFDIPWERLQVKHVEQLEGFDVSEYQVVLRGKRRAMA
ncbi:MAG: transcriptional repressor [Polyangiaceae bacterium]|nr:transcriptional repressor [Polyangiaceae bacterium]